jgi:glucosamine kinase
MDGRAESGPLAEAIWSRCGSRRTDLQVWCANAAQFAYAQLAPLVFDVAFHDAAAEQILVDAAHALEALAHGLDPAGALPLAICGSVGQRLQSRFEPVLRARAVAPWVGPAEGALLLLRNL